MSKPKEEEEDGEGARGAEEEIREHWCWWCISQLPLSCTKGLMWVM